MSLFLFLCDKVVSIVRVPILSKKSKAIASKRITESLALKYRKIQNVGSGPIEVRKHILMGSYKRWGLYAGGSLHSEGLFGR